MAGEARRGCTVVTAPRGKRATKPRLGGISFVEYQTDKGRDEALIRSLAGDLDVGRLPENSAYYGKVLRRYLAGYPSPPKHRPASRVTYWIAALYWLLRDHGDKLAANRVAAWCRANSIDRAAQSVSRAATTAQGRAARERIRQSIASHAHCEPQSVLAAHRVAIEERIIAWARKDDAFGIARKMPAERNG